jgi:hypothetical protein
LPDLPVRQVFFLIRRVFIFVFFYLIFHRRAFIFIFTGGFPSSRRPQMKKMRRGNPPQWEDAFLNHPE